MEAEFGIISQENASASTISSLSTENVSRQKFTVPLEHSSIQLLCSVNVSQINGKIPTATILSVKISQCVFLGKPILSLITNAAALQGLFIWLQNKLVAIQLVLKAKDGMV